MGGVAMNLREVIAAFCEVERGISISEPFEERIKVAYPFLPAANQALDTPCTMHQYRRLTAARGPNGLRRDAWMIRTQMLVARSNVDPQIWSEAAAAFDQVLIEAFDAHVLLGSFSAFQRITDEQAEYQPGLIDWNGIGFIGCQYDYRVDANAVALYGT